MPNTGQGQKPNATIINIHSPSDEILTVPEQESFRRPSTNSKQPHAKPSPKVEEYKKMIQHIVGKIMKRKKPPNALQYLSDICQSVNVPNHFENDDTIDLLVQLRSALLVCHQVGLSSQVLMQGEKTPTPSPSSSRANSPTPSPRIGSPSKSVENASTHIPPPKNEKRSEFETILYVLSDLILNDSRFKTANPKPSRPPYTMQTILIDIGLILIQVRDDSAGLYNIGTLYLPAFESFSEGSMLGKLLSLFLDNLLPKLMKCKDEPKSRSMDIRKSDKNDTSKPTSKTQSYQNTPIINIENSESELADSGSKLLHLKIDTQPYSIETVSPQQTLSHHHAFSLFTSLVFFMIQYLDPYLSHHDQTKQTNSIHNFHRALSYMTTVKPDLYLDLLDVISHSTSEAKFRACHILFQYYNLGHVIIADSPFENDEHEWYPYMFGPAPTGPDDVDPAVCQSCFKLVEGFGLRCFECQGSLHIHCATTQDMMFYVKGRIQKVVTPHVGHLRERVRLNSRLLVTGHTYKLVNLYTLMLCSCCHKPLWGISHQAYRCGDCKRTVHPECLRDEPCQASLQESDLQISPDELNRSFQEFYRDMIQPDENRGLEETETILNILVIQERLLHAGLAAGCILTDTEGCPALSLAIQRNPKLKGSSFYHDFFETGQMEGYLFNQEDYLSHLAAMMKSLVVLDKRRSVGDGRGFLQVAHQPVWEDEFSEIPNEVLDRSVLVSWLMNHLNFKSRKAAEMLLQQMMNLGLFERLDASPVLFPYGETGPVQCIFPVSYGIDDSPNVESLINSIDACLRDVDLSLNECGLLLLVRRCWPDPFMSSYTKERLIQAIAEWTLDEDERLLTLYSELTSGGKARAQHKKQSAWAKAILVSRMNGGAQYDRTGHSVNFQPNTVGVSSGASTMYVTTRSTLRDRYIIRWLSAIQQMDPKEYADIVFDTIETIIDNKREESMIVDWDELYNIKKLTIQKYELFISYIVKLKTSGLTFSSFDLILKKWFEVTHTEFSNLGVLKDKIPLDIRHLAKLCSTRPPLNSSSGAAPSADSSNPVEIIAAQLSLGDPASIERGMQWLTLLVHSGTGVPSNSLANISKLIIKSNAPLRTIAEFAKIVWHQAANIANITLSRAAILEIFGNINEVALEVITAASESQILSSELLSSAQTLIKYSSALACFAFSCPSKNVLELGIVPSSGDQTLNNHHHNRRATFNAENISALIEADEKTPLIKCLLSYLKIDQLNAREDVVKLFYAVSYWGYGLSNKDGFIAKCMPQLIFSVWELLSPTYDHLSDINLNLLMKLISIDIRYFQACVFKVFEDTNWEVRYQGLDNLFGLFTKMDAAFQTEWLKLLSHLGPVFSYFVSCLWDKEEYVRSKAHALIRTFGTLHLRSAFRCWEAYFLTATDRQKMSLVSLMIQLNALFPEWQVLQWESLIEALERPSFDILDEYTRVPSMDHTSIKEGLHIPHTNSPHQLQDQQMTESDNVKVLMLTLALQLLSNQLSIKPAQILRLKFVLVQQMGFQNCQLFNDRGKTIIKFGPLEYNSKDRAKVATMIACVRGLKKIMDSFAPLPAEKIANMASDSLEQGRLNLSENSSPGVHFIDVVLKMVNSDVDLVKLGHLILKGWLEIILIILYKHDILDINYERSIVICMKQIIDLLTEDISEENKLLILEILKCLLNRSDHLTAMVLSKQILALGRLMTKLGVRNSEPVYLKAKQFLKSAFLRFAVAGLFVLMFKNQAVTDTTGSDVDLFFVLRTAIDPEDVIPDEDMNGETIYLRDQPLRDVIDKLMKQQMERKAFSTVLYNTSRYIETVHTHPYSENVLNDYSGFMYALIKHTTDWRRSDWNINPVLTMSATLLKEHPYHHSILLQPLQALLKHGLANCTIQPEAVVKMIVAYHSILSIPGTQPNNVFVDIVIDEIKNALSASNKSNKDTLLVLLQLVLWDIKSMGREWYAAIEDPILGQNPFGANRISYFEIKLLTLLPYFVNYLKKPPVSQQFTRKDFKIYSCAAQLIVSMCSRDPKLMVIIFGYLKLEDSAECLRFLPWFVLTLLKEHSDNILYDMLEYEVVLTELLVKTIRTAEIDFHTPDLNFTFSQLNEKLSPCFLLLKSYILLKIRSGTVNNDKAIRLNTMNPMSFWMTTWPAIRRLLGSVEPSTLFMTGSLGLPLWNMFLSLLQFLFASRSEVVMINSYEWKELLDNLLEKLKDNNSNIDQDTSGVDFIMTIESFRNRIVKLKEMFDVPPVEVPSMTMVNQLLLELRDIMRSQAESLAIEGSSRVLNNNSNPGF